MRIRAGRETKPKLPLTVLTGCPDDLRVMQEEIFGPVLPLVAVESLDAAIAYPPHVSERPHPLRARALPVLRLQRAARARAASQARRRRERERNADAHRAGSPAVRRRRPIPHEPLPRQVWLRHDVKTQTCVSSVAHQWNGIVRAAVGCFFLADD